MAKKVAKKKAVKKTVKKKVKKAAKSSKKGVKKKSPGVVATFLGDRILCEKTAAAQELYNHSRFGYKNDNKEIELSFHDAVYLVEKQKVSVNSGSKVLTKDQLIKKSVKLDKNFLTKYAVYKDFRDRGYIIKTALKFGADFRVYDRGIKPGQDHAKWVVFPVKEATTLTWHDFSAKNRVAHSTKKRLLIGCVDDEGAVTYWEIRWIRP